MIIMDEDDDFFICVIIMFLVSKGTVTQLESSPEPLDDVFFPSVSSFTFQFNTQSIIILPPPYLPLLKSFEITRLCQKVTICNLNQVTGSWFDEVKNN